MVEVPSDSRAVDRRAAEVVGAAVNVADRTVLVEFDPRRIDELLPMWRASFETGVGIIDPHPPAEQRQYFLTEVLPRNEVRFALLDHELVGFIAASTNSIAQLYVRVGVQRCGVGSRLLTWAKERSGGSLWLYTFTRNLGARTFYERHGFTAVAHGFEPMWQLDDIRYEWAREAEGRRSDHAPRGRAPGRPAGGS